MHFIGRVTMLFANNSLMECLITMKFFTLVNNAIPSYDIAFDGITILQVSTSHIMRLAYR